MFVDTHCHISGMVNSLMNHTLKESDCAAVRNIVNQAADSGIDAMINIGVNVVETKNSLFLAKHFREIFATVGIHPCDCEDSWKDDLQSFEPFLKQKKEHKIVGIGETGFDFFHKPFNPERQAAAFKQHIELALQYDLPLVIHSREAHDETLKVLEEYVPNGLRGVWHCFSHPAYVSQQAVAWGFFVGIGGYITYPKNNELRSVIQEIPVERLLLETDAPFLPPQVLRGKQNSPAYIALFAPLVADLKTISVEELGKITTKNAQTLFDIY